jgi:hypothetical protein
LSAIRQVLTRYSANVPRFPVNDRSRKLWPATIVSSGLPQMGRGVQETRIADNKEAFGVIYVASIGTNVYVLHAFHKKSTEGIETAQTDMELARRR